MKRNYYPLLIAISSFLILLNTYAYISAEQQLAYYKEVNNGITFVWNDDEESLPVDGTPIMLQYTNENTVYIGPIENESILYEYQFTITGDSMSVYNFNRHVGTVKVEGQLEQLLIKDNE